MSMRHLVLLFGLCLGFIPSADAATQLKLKFHKQLKNLSCEAAALRMVLNFHKVSISEAEIIEKMPVDQTPKKGNVWGDPDKGFVGDINGDMGITGYGIHWNALARLASHWKKTDVLESGSIKDLVSHLDSRRPVITWGVRGKGEEISWVTPEGRKIFARNNEHARVVFGYQGSKEAPTKFHVMDPVSGPELLSTEEFLKDWDSFGRKAVVVFR